MMKVQTLTKRYAYLLMGASLFLLPLVHAWMIYPLGIENYSTSYSALGGILPWSDAQGYYSGANTLLENGFLDYWNIRRPLNAILFSLRLFVTNNHFEMSLILQALLCGVSCLLVTTSIHRIFGTLSSIMTLFILFLFAAIFIPTTLSETLGLTLGCLGFVLLWEAVIVSKQKIILWLFFTAGLILMVGLNVRAGAFFILPLLILWLGFNFKDNTTSYRFNWPISSVFILGILSAIIFNLILIKLNYDSTNIVTPHGNFCYTLFGLVSGGKGWYHAYNLYPEIVTKSEAEIATFLYSKSLEVFKNNPLLLAVGVLKNWGDTLKAICSFFQSSLPSGIIIKTLIRLFGFISLCFGLYYLKVLYKTYKNEVGLISIVLLGMLLSAGGIWSDGGFRVFAVTVPFFAAAFGIIIGSYTNASVVKVKESFTPHVHWETKVALLLSGILLTFGLTGPLLNRFYNSPVIPNFSCATGETKVLVRNIAGTPYIKLPLQGALFKKSILKSLIENKQDFLRILELEHLKNTKNLAAVYDINTAQTRYILGSPEIFSTQNTWTGLCATNIPGIENIMKVQSFEVLNEK